MPLLIFSKQVSQKLGLRPPPPYPPSCSVPAVKKDGVHAWLQYEPHSWSLCNQKISNIWLKHSDTEKLFCVPNLLDSLLKWRMMLTTDMQHRYLSFCNFILLLILICLPWIHDPYDVHVQDFKPLIPIKHSDYCFFLNFIYFYHKLICFYIKLHVLLIFPFKVWFPISVLMVPEPANC